MVMTNAEKQAAWRSRRGDRDRAAAEKEQNLEAELKKAREEIADLRHQVAALAKHIASLTTNGY